METLKIINDYTSQISKHRCFMSDSCIIDVQFANLGEVFWKKGMSMTKLLAGSCQDLHRYGKPAIILARGPLQFMILAKIPW